MKKNLTKLIIGLGIVGSAMAQTITTGPSSSQSPYLNPVTSGYSITSVITASQTVGNYTVSGLLDGAGAFDNNDGTFTMLISHEAGNTAGSVRTHGSAGAFVSKWVINKTTLAVVSGVDLIQNVYLWNPSTSTYSIFNATTPSTLAAFNRFCSSDLPEVSAFYNSYTGKGTKERIFMNGEEAGAGGRAFAHIATGPAAGNTYELPYLGKFSWENSVASPNRSDKTIVIGTDDATPGQVYVYVGNKSTTGTDINKAGLVGGNLYGVGVAGLLTEVSASFPAANTTFSLIDLGQVHAITGASLQTKSTNLGVTQFLRPEDGVWDPANPRDFYFVTTNGFNNPSRMWRLRFNNIENPQLGGTITAVLDGTEGQQMMDNIGIDNSGHILIQEDTGNQTYIGKIWEYTIATDVLTQVAEHDPTRFLVGGANFLTQDEESSGIIDAQAILGAGKFLFVDQAHCSIPAPVLEGGQILVLTSQKTATSNPEVNIQGNAVNIPLGNTAISAGNNTDFGTVNTGVAVNKSFVIQNTGTGPLVISSMFISGTNAGDFTFVNAPAYPLTIAAGASQNFTVSFNPALVGTRNATVSVNNNDFNENLYDFGIQGIGAAPEINLQGNSANIASGSNAPNVSNDTDFGSIIYNNTVTKSFLIQNTGTGTLTVSGIAMSGANASEFTLVNAPAFPFNLSGSASQSFTVQFLPTSVGTSSATISIANTDSDESNYTYVVSGKGTLDVGLNTFSKTANSISLFPNPAKDEAMVKLNLENSSIVTVNVYDLLGKKVMTLSEKNLNKGEQQIILTTATLKNGDYFVEVKADNKKTSIKLIVAH